MRYRSVFYLTFILLSCATLLSTAYANALGWFCIKNDTNPATKILVGNAHYETQKTSWSEKFSLPNSDFNSLKKGETMCAKTTLYVNAICEVTVTAWTVTPLGATGKKIGEITLGYSRMLDFTTKASLVGGAPFSVEFEKNKNDGYTAVIRGGAANW